MDSHIKLPSCGESPFDWIDRERWRWRMTGMTCPDATEAAAMPDPSCRPTVSRT